MKPDEPGLPWASYVDTEDIYKFDPLTSWEMSKKMRDRVIGLQAQLWSETVIDSKQMDYYLFPRLISFAERAWNPDHQRAKLEVIPRNYQEKGIRLAKRIEHLLSPNEQISLAKI